MALPKLLPCWPTGSVPVGDTVPITALHLAQGLSLPEGSAVLVDCSNHVSFSTHWEESRTSVCPTKTPVNSQQTSGRGSSW